MDWVGRLTRDRIEIVPWLDRTRSVRGAAILEIGCGSGASTLSLAEQGARVIGVDSDENAVRAAQATLATAGVEAEFRCGNAAQPDVYADLDWVIFWASLEHMLFPERLSALRHAWHALPPGGLLTVIETPNRLWPQDSHTSQLPFFSWLPDDLAFAYARLSPRPTFGGDSYTNASEQLAGFLRRGRGVSFHEFDLAIGDHRRLSVRSCMQLARRARNPIRAAGWYASAAGRTERALHSFSEETHRAWFQPFLYLTLEKSGP